LTSITCDLFIVKAKFAIGFAPFLNFIRYSFKSFLCCRLRIVNQVLTFAVFLQLNEQFQEIILVLFSTLTANDSSNETYKVASFKIAEYLF